MIPLKNSVPLKRIKNSLVNLLAITFCLLMIIPSLLFMLPYAIYSVLPTKNRGF